jgi:hypothetical protein
VTAIEGRRPAVERARFVKEALGLEHLELLYEDVRRLDRDRHGEFDLVLCLGILYHLPAPDVFRLVHELAGVTRRAVIIDTHVSLVPRLRTVHRDRTYWGRAYREHDPSSSPEERIAVLRSSLDNPESFWLTRPSLYNLLGHAGFTSVLEVRLPRPLAIPDRLTLVALRGSAEPASYAPAPWHHIEWRETDALPPTFPASRWLARGLRARLGTRLDRLLAPLRRWRGVAIRRQERLDR